METPKNTGHRKTASYKFTNVYENSAGCDRFLDEISKEKSGKEAHRRATRRKTVITNMPTLIIQQICKNRWLRVGENR
jgi:hypothetical protein